MRVPKHITARTQELAFAALALLCLWSCQKEAAGYKDTVYEDRKVMILYSAGHNNISGNLIANINDLLKYTDFHTDDPDADAVLVFTHSKSGKAVPYLLYPHKDKNGDLLIDTLITFSSNTISASAQTLNTVLSYVKDKFPADEYGLVFSSHGTGYLPAGYYDYESTYENSYTGTSLVNRIQNGTWTYLDPEPVPDRVDNPFVKSIGNDKEDSGSYEINLDDFADAIPMKMKYIVFDACLLGGIEEAYELRDKTEWLIASPVEILAEGMDYSTMVSYLMARPEGDYEGFCENYYEHYNSYSGSNHSATISLTDCSRTELLAQVCRELFSKYREALDNIDHTEIQRYYTYSIQTGEPYHWFFDFGDIVEHLGCTDKELAEFNEALDACVVYKAATEYYLPTLGGTDITHFSGLSMMLPNYAGDYLKDFYKSHLAWNDATSLVE